MSYTTIAQAVSDAALQSRVNTAVQKESRSNPELAASPYAADVRAGTVNPNQWFGWPVAIATEAQYESAIAGDNPNPGGDPAVITDGDILSAVQANWPPDPAP